MYNNHEQFMYDLERKMVCKSFNDFPRYDLQIGDKLYDVTEEGEDYLLWTSQDSTDELLVEYDLEKSIRLQYYCIRKIGDVYWEVLDFQEEIYNNNLKQNIIGFGKALKTIYDYDLMELVELACDSFVPDSQDGFAVLDLTNGKVIGITLQDQTMMKPQYLDIFMVNKEMLDDNYELYLKDDEIDRFEECGESVAEWMDDNEIDLYLRLIDGIFFSFQDKDEYELWERGVRRFLDEMYSDFYSRHPENAVK